MVRDTRLVQTAVLGDEHSDVPVVLPQEAIELDQFRHVHEHDTYWCGLLLGGCGSELTTKRYLDRQCHFSHVPLPSGVPHVCRRPAVGEASADHLYVKSAMSQSLLEYGRAARFAFPPPIGSLVDVDLEDGTSLRVHMDSAVPPNWTGGRAVVLGPGVVLEPGVLAGLPVYPPGPVRERRDRPPGLDRHPEPRSHDRLGAAERLHLDFGRPPHPGRSTDPARTARCWDRVARYSRQLAGPLPSSARQCRHPDPRARGSPAHRIGRARPPAVRRQHLLPRTPGSISARRGRAGARSGTYLAGRARGLPTPHLRRACPGRHSETCLGRPPRSSAGLRAHPGAVPARPSSRCSRPHAASSATTTAPVRPPPCARRRSGNAPGRGQAGSRQPRPARQPPAKSGRSSASSAVKGTP